MNSPVGLLVKLKWVLTWRGYRSDKWKALSSIILFISLATISFFAVFGLNWLLQNIPDQALRPLVARDALTVLYLLWALTPLMGFHLNESYDVTKLFGYPITPRQILMGIVLGSFFDISMLLLLPVSILLLCYFTSSFISLICNVLLLGMFVLQTVMLGQTVTLLLIGFLRSRRFRDMTVILLPLVSALSYLVQQTIIFQFRHIAEREVIDARVWLFAEFLPSGWLARSLQAVSESEWPLAIIFAVLMLQTFLATLAMASWTLDNLYRGDAGPREVREKEVAQANLADIRRPILGKLPPEVSAILFKEMLYMRREPQYKALASQVVYMLVVLIIIFVAPGMSNGLSLINRWVRPLMFLPLCLAVFSFSLPLLFNLFGGEGAAVTMLFSFPVRRRSLLLGKNIAHAAVLICVMTASVLVLACITGEWRYVPYALGGTILATPVLLGAGNLVSIRFPHRMLVRGQRWQKGGVASASGDSGCAYSLLYSVANFATMVALIPVAAVVLIPIFLEGIAPILYVLLFGVAFMYSISVYLVLLGKAEEWLLAREPEIAAKVVPVD